jgi:hypothetical protein
MRTPVTLTNSKLSQRSDRRSNDRRNNRSVIKSRYRIVRLYTSISVILSVFSILFEPSSIHSKVVGSAELPMVLFYTALVVGFIALLDIFINDILPNKYSFKQAYLYRHLVYMSLSLISFSLSAGLLITFGGSILVGRLWLDGAVAASVAVLDIFARHRKKI